MPKVKTKSPVKNAPAPRVLIVKKLVKVELNQPVCKEEDLIGISGDASTIDLTRNKFIKREFVPVKEEQEAQQSVVWPQNEQYSDSEQSQHSDWFEKFFDEQDKKGKVQVAQQQEAPQRVIVQKTIEVVTTNEDDEEDIPMVEERLEEEEEEEDDNVTLASDDSFDKYFEETEKQRIVEETKQQKKKEPRDPNAPKRKRVRLEYSMVQHLEGYEVESRIFCSICNDHFNQMPGHPKNYNDHIIKVHAHKVGEDLYVCTYCDNKTPKTLKNLKMHLFRHREMAKPKVCSACGETFTEYNKWRCHMRMEKGVNGRHSDKQCYPCETCGKVCSSKYNLNMHIITIHEKRGRNCRWCPRIVPLDEWEEHKAMEKEKHGVRVPTTCDVCGATFTSKDSAANHRRNFHRNIILECPLCPKTFNSSTALSQHKAFKHTEKRFECAYCNKKYAYRYEAKKHMTKKHKIEKDEITEDSIIEHKASDIPEFREPPVKRLKEEEPPMEEEETIVEYEIVSM
ncbi:zinc finger protein 180-like [Culicoides brevitarsis]|uniref:zinc finger protein 180-like n=1 Tax=Culicoides brevitarsis TaxID=469753 RepID=UPI00307B5A47